VIDLQEDGHPRLPVFDIDLVAPNATAEVDDVGEPSRSDSPPSPEKCTADSERSTPFSLASLNEDIYNDGILLGSPLSVIGPTQSTPPLSESMIKVAIENVAEAGYLSISDETATRTPNQGLHNLKTVSQEADKGKASNSNSKKRRREEIKQGGDEQTKRSRRKVPAVPTREQSSRYDALDIFIGCADVSFNIASKTSTIRTPRSLFAPVRLITISSIAC
jgi:hypothetical protein